MSDQDLKDDAYWQQKLSTSDYKICRQKGTERAFTGKYWDIKTKGTYLCKCCQQALFESDAKFDSGTGWPSFYQPVDADAVGEHTDSTLGMTRTEVVCDKCGSHLGHVFPDGPAPTGLRYCINSASLVLEEPSAEVDKEPSAKGDKQPSAAITKGPLK